MTAYLGQDIPKLGFGLMRLPMLGDDVDMAQTIEMTDLFMKHGYTYFDTAYGYIDGKSEEAIKVALVDRYPRESFQLATKLPAWAGPKTEKEAQDMFWTSLKRTGAGYFDFYLLHNLGSERSASFEKYHIWEFLAEQKDKGLIRHLGFSMHDKPEALDEVLSQHPEMEFVQLQINYADWNNAMIESRRCYETARKHNKPIVIMEPVRGGNLAPPPGPVADLLRRANPGASPASWALRFCAQLDGVITVLSGMSTIGQMRDNLDTMDHFSPLSGDEQSVISEAQTIFASIPVIPCTGCRYCTQNCPQGIDIPEVLGAMNLKHLYDDLQGAKNRYQFTTVRSGKASACVACGQCETACPQRIQIIHELEKIAGLLEE